MNTRGDGKNHDEMNTAQRPTSAVDVCDIIRSARESDVPVYPQGGATSLDYGCAAREAGIELQLAGLDKVIDYPAADMTITVESGITMKQLASVLSEHGQQLPLDVPRSDVATLGGVLATDFCGARRYGYGTARDYVIGIQAVDGRGEMFAGGGRVVKNVAGYDFCKMLVGSLGSLAVMTEVTLKLLPLRTTCAAVVVAPTDETQVESILSGLVHSETEPVAIEWIIGSAWHEIAAEQAWPSGDQAGWLVLCFEGTEPEVVWMSSRMSTELDSVDCHLPRCTVTANDDYRRLMNELSEFPADPASPVVVKAGVRPSQTATMVDRLRALASGVSIQAHAGSGIIRARLDEAPAEGIASAVIRHLHPLVSNHEGHVVLLRNQDDVMTRQSVWGTLSGPRDIMARIKNQFDPDDILNRGRFVT